MGKPILIAAIALLASNASAETLYRGKVYKITADRIIIRERMACTYEPWRFQTLDNGTTALIRAKTCIKESTRHDQATQAH